MRPASAGQSSAEVRPRELPINTKEPALEESALPHADHGPEDAPRVRGGAAGTPADDELSAAVSAARAGDEAAFVILWRALHPPLLRYLAVRGDDAPEDIASETWMHVVKGLSGFEGNAAEFRAWLFTIARHRAVDQGRARTRRPAVPVSEPATLPARDVAPSAEEQAVANDATARALELVATLPPAQAEMVMLRVVAGLEVADVARLVDKKPGAVRVAVHRALQRLAGQVARHPEARSNREVV